MKITIGLNENSIAEAITQLKDYKKGLQRKTHELIKTMLRNGERIAEHNLANHRFTGITENSIMSYRKGNNGILIVGGAAIWLEFGTGIVKNTRAYPKQINGIVPHGQYGKGKGSNPDGWYFPLPENEAQAYVAHYGGRVVHTKSGDTLVHTKGVKATYFMYDTAMQLRAMVGKLAKDIYGIK